MIQLSKNYSLPERESESIPIKVVGIGGAGSNALDRVVLDGLERADLVAINTDVQSLASSVAATNPDRPAPTMIASAISTIGSSQSVDDTLSSDE